MKRQSSALRLTAVLLSVIFLQSIMLPGLILGQSSDCSYDRNNPTLENARKSFLALNYKCAEEEISKLLENESIDIQSKADAHILMAEVYYAKVRNNSEKKEKVIGQFIAAFNAYREWRGELNIKSPEFMAMMKEAQDMVDKGETEAKVETEAEPKPVKVEITEKKTPEKGEKKGPWYTKWWAIGLGVGVVVGGVILIAGGGDDEETELEPLPPFPDPPGKR